MKNPCLSCSNISFSIGEQVILRDVSFTLYSGEIIALVGPNGVGKSTLLKLIAGLQESNGGNIERTKNIKIAYLSQEVSAKSLELRGKDYVGDIHETSMVGLNLDYDILNKQISSLSGGERSKINLLKMIGSRSDVYLLDEPTNNLDLQALEFLSNFINSNKGRSAFIIVSHDRQLLEDTADKILEIDLYNRSSSIYPYKFSKYLLIRRQRIANEWGIYNDFLAKKRFLEHSLIEKIKWSQIGERGPKKTDNEKMASGNAKDWSGKVLGKSIKVAQRKLAELESVEKPREMPVLSYDFSIKNRGGDIVFHLKEAVKKFEGRTIGPINLDIQFGDRLVITGSNGSGKTTLIKMLTSRISLDVGIMKHGSAVDIGYLPQESELTDKVLLSEIKKMDSDSETEFRKILHRFGITKEGLKKGRNELSPGERSRFILALLISKRPNCLILDEPTNHLDIYALDFLEESIRTYKGTIIVVTHDRYFMNRIGDYRVFNLQ